MKTKTKTAKQIIAKHRKWMDRREFEEWIEDDIVSVMEEYSEQNTDVIYELFSKPYQVLKPLEDLWRKENHPDQFVLPDTTQFYKWIVDKILNHDCLKNVVSDAIKTKNNQVDFWKLKSTLITPETWMCPRCGTIHSYLKTSCDCPPETKTSITFGK